MAMVVGVGGYPGDAALRNPAGDANQIAAALRDNRFEVETPLIDPGKKAFDSALRSFRGKVEAAVSAGDDVVVFFYYSGHGIAVPLSNDNGGERLVSYLVPLGTDIFDGDVKDQYSFDGAILAASVRDRLVASRAPKIMIVLDACRNAVVSFGTKSRPSNGFGSLPEQSAASEVLILYATQPGGKAIDSLGAGGINKFSEALAAALRREPSLDQVVAAVKREVRDATGKRQIPAASGSLDFTLDPERQLRKSLAQADRAMLARVLQQEPGLFVGVRAVQTGDLTASAAPLKGVESREAKPVVQGRTVVPIGASLLPDGDAGPWKRVPILDGQKEARDYIKTRGMDALLNDAASGNAHGEYLAGVAYSLGYGGEVNFKMSNQFLERAYQHGEARAANALGVAWFNGDGVEKNTAEARRWWEIGERAHVGTAIANLGTLYEDEEAGGPKDPVKAASYYRRAALLGSSFGMSKLATILRGRDLGPPQPGEAMQLYQRLRQHGDADAVLQIAYMYMNGEGVRSDPIQINVYLRHAAELGSVAAASTLSERLFAGTGVPAPDPSNGVFYLKKAAEGGYVDSMVLLGRKLRGGNKDVAADPDEAFIWFQRAARKGSVAARTELSKAFLDGAGTPKDTERGLAGLLTLVKEEIGNPRPDTWPMEYYGAGIELADRLTKLKRDVIDMMTLDKLKTLYVLPGNMKRFTVPIDCAPAGATGRGTTPFHVYVFDWGRETDMLQPQFDWVERQRGCRVPENVRESFAKLFKIAKDNHVNFADLTVYALGEAQKTPDPPKTS